MDRLNLHQGSMPSGTPRLAAVLWACGAVAVLFMAALTVQALHGRATGHHDRLVALAGIDATARQARLGGWMLIEETAGAAGGRAQQQRLIDDLASRAASDESAVALALAPYAASLQAELDALSTAGGADAARTIALERREPAFTQLEAAMNARADHHVAALRRADDIAVGGSAMAMTLAALAVGVLAWRFVRVRASIEHDALSRSEARFRHLVHGASDIIAVLDERLRATYLSPSAERLLGYTTSQLLARSIEDLFVDEDRPVLLSRLHALALAPDVRISLEARLSCRDGSSRYSEVIASNLLHERSVGGLVLNIRDINDRKELEERLRRRALHDALTGLPNREQFIERVEARLTRRDAGATRSAVLFMDLDQFKSINDTLGHHAGDELLIAVARRLQTCVGVDDLVARLSGDEFAILLSSPRRPQDVTDVAEQILDVLHAPIAAGGATIHTGASIGIAFDASDIDGVGTLLRRADSAMYAAKRAGGGRYAIDALETPHAEDPRLIIEELREAS
jgi:diguanylate cyclase (GGDEF)-like protein/PAS domain S-box-containing protein